jgi:two-component system response regulator DevR
MARLSPTPAPRIEVRAGPRLGPGRDPATDQGPEQVRIMLVDDHAIVRQGLRSILERESDLSVTAEASKADEALTVVGRVRPHIVLLDLKLSTSSDTEGLDLCAALVERYPEIGVLVLTTFLDEQLVLRAIRSGARGYVVKDVDTSALVRAIRDVARGGSAFDARSAAAMVRGLNAPAPEDNEHLTGRELEVLRLLARGLSNKDIGAELYVSETTAKFHVGNILRKLGVSRRAEAVYEASKLGLI